MNCENVESPELGTGVPACPSTARLEGLLQTEHHWLDFRIADVAA